MLLLSSIYVEGGGGGGWRGGIQIRTCFNIEILISMELFTGEKIIKILKEDE